MERVHQVILNMIVTKDLSKKVFNYIYIWGETLASIAREIRASYHRNIQTTPGKVFFGRDMIFNLTPVADWRFITGGKQQQVEIDNV